LNSFVQAWFEELDKVNVTEANSPSGVETHLERKTEDILVSHGDMEAEERVIE